ncbi:glycogen operon protein [Cryobacterium mesophilum]|uniref:Glycogen debranching enzyme GlgX n=1 Tax=Terrimesophilobacter mesophilus TaxID=433647 RepID=A0A4R8VBE7_9MICO|nr:glycogen debranching protein GlgX [Terrimesophilobacter mesophilus]MBB5633958.1 glycogen operon protein [Terrimesophilobacter mesophilus]TFB80621.1 glycogen debranching enzyme GlgX [Terrimesophilobacter mesophilus]
MSTTDPLHDLGARLTEHGGRVRVYSASAASIELCLFSRKDPYWITDTIPLEKTVGDVWTVTSPKLVAGRNYTLRAAADTGSRGAAAPNRFDPNRNLIDPYSRGLSRAGNGEWRSCIVDDEFDWGGTAKPVTPIDHTVIYEAHAKGLTKLNPDVPSGLRGSYAGLAHESTIAYLNELGVTAVELLPVHQFVTEQRLVKMGLSNYWGYNSLNFFTPHMAWASAAAQEAGSAAVVREFKGMVKLLHEAGIEVILDVVYNHTSEEGPDGPTTSLRGLDDRTYYRQSASGDYIDVTGCGNSIDASNPVAQRLIMDSLRYWANEMQVDGFRFDLAATLGRDAEGNFDPQHPLLKSIVSDPDLSGVKMIAEPWDVGPNGWQTGRFPQGWLEWNDGYRDRVRDFWLTDIASARAHGTAPIGIGPLATKLSGSSNEFSAERGPIASVNFVTAHDGFTLADLTAYDSKHNLGNGEDNRDGTNDNHSFNHGVEGPTDDPVITTVRRKAMRNLLATLLLSAGTPMLTAGDEIGRSQRGNNNAYCHDDELSWLPWKLDGWQRDMLHITRAGIRFRKDNPAVRPRSFGVWGETLDTATQMDWFNASGQTMSIDDWNSPSERTLQYLAAANHEVDGFNRILLIVHGVEADETVTLPTHSGVQSYTLLFDSANDTIESEEHAPGTTLAMTPTSLKLFRAH